MLHEYLEKIADTTAQGNAREESYYAHLSSFVQSFAKSIDRKKIQITTLPKKTKAGNPDFRIWDGQQSIVMLFESEENYGKEGRKPNISKEVLEKLEKAYKKNFTPEQLLYYVYAILYSNTYRQKYAEFLKIDFPRIPFTAEYKLFVQLAELDEQLTELHLLKSKALNKPVAKYKGKGDDRVEKPKYNKELQTVFINEKNYFEGVSTEVWNYNIGGYHVMEKYLKDRKGKLMEDPGHYCKMATAIAETILV